MLLTSEKARRRPGDAKKQSTQIRQDKADDAKLLVALDALVERAESTKAEKHKGGKSKKGAMEKMDRRRPTVTDLQVHSRLSGARAKRAVERLLSDGIIEEVEIVVWSGKGREVAQTKIGYQRAKKAEQTDLTEQLDGGDASAVGRRVAEHPPSRRASGRPIPPVE